jgi:hypothetical protein
VYDRHSFVEERRIAIEKLAAQVEWIVNRKKTWCRWCFPGSAKDLFWT